MELQDVDGLEYLQAVNHEIDTMDVGLEELRDYIELLQLDEVLVQPAAADRACLFVTEQGVFNMARLAYPAYYEEIADLDQSIIFNLCQRQVAAEDLADTVVEQYCDRLDAFAFHVEDSKCTAFTAPAIEAWPALAYPAVAKGLDVPSDGGISLHYAVAGSVCQQTGGEKRMKVSLLCDPLEPELRYIDQRFYGAQCTMELRYATLAGCPMQDWAAELQNEDLVHEIAQDIENVGNKVKQQAKTLKKGGLKAQAQEGKTKAQDFVAKNPVLCGMILIPTGALFAFLGWYMLDVILAITAFTAATAACAYFGLQLVEMKYAAVDSEPGWLIWSILGLSLLVGLLAGFCIRNLRALGTSILAGVGGAIGGSALVHLFGITGAVVSWALIVICIMAAVMLVRFVEFTLILAMTSIGGSYMLTRGVSFFVGGFPDEAAVKDLVAQGIKPWTQFKYFWAYAGVIITLSVIAFMVQLKVTGAWKKKERAGAMSEGERSQSAN